MSTHVILGTPGAFDFKAFSQSASKAMALLASLLQSNAIGTSQISKKIATQAQQYIVAIQKGVMAAQQGFAAAEDILGLAEVMDKSNPQEINDYLVGTLHLAEKAYTEASQTHQTLREIRTTLFKLTEDLKQASTKASKKSPTVPVPKPIDNLQQSTDVLEAFSTQISDLAQWWEWIRIESRPLKSGVTSQPSIDLSSLSQPVSIARWKLLRGQFAEYKLMVEELDDKYRHLLPKPTKQASVKTKGATQVSNATFTSNIRLAIAGLQASHTPNTRPKPQKKNTKERSTGNTRIGNGGTQQPNNNSTQTPNASGKSSVWKKIIAVFRSK